MVTGNLKSYVRSLLKQGYSPDSIKRTLSAAGHSDASIEVALRSGSSTSGKPVMLVLGLILLIAIGGATFYFVGGQKIKMISLSLDPSITNVDAGDELIFSSILRSPQSKEVAVTLTHELIDQRKKQVVLTETDDIIVGDSASVTTRMEIPQSLETGAYLIRTIANYDGKKQVKTFMFNVEASQEVDIPIEDVEEITFEEAEYDCPLGCEDYDPCSKDTCVRGVCKHTRFRPCCGNAICESDEDILNCAEDCSPEEKPADDVKEEALMSQSVKKAAELCSSLSDPDDADQCFVDLSKKSKESKVCGNILNTVSRDGCYFDFAYDEDFSVCSKVQDTYLVRSCLTMKALSEIEVSEDGA